MLPDIPQKVCEIPEFSARRGNQQNKDPKTFTLFNIMINLAGQYKKKKPKAGWCDFGGMQEFHLGPSFSGSTCLV